MALIEYKSKTAANIEGMLRSDGLLINNRTTRRGASLGQVRAGQDLQS